MAQRVDLGEVQRLMGEGAQVVEVLPAQDYQWGHLPGARSIPIKTLNATTAATLDRERPIVLYCNDFQ